MFKKPGILLPCNNLPSVNPHRNSSKTSPCPRRLRPQPWQQQRRPYARVSDAREKRNCETLCWPELSNANTIPTPYQIFNQKKGSPYSKQRFYELVKLYHPDRHDLDHSTDGLSHATKLERYRLVVAANDILSDAVKRSAFDVYGAGWNGCPEVKSRRDNSSSSSKWGNGPNGPSQNATWEDWEKWYKRDGKGPQEPQFVSNSAFVGLIVLFAILGGIGQASRVDNFSKNFLDQRDALHDNISKDLVRRRRESTSVFGSSDERIRHFLRQRDPVGNGVTDPRKGDTKLLPAPEVGLSDRIKAQRRNIDGKSKPDGG